MFLKYAFGAFFAYISLVIDRRMLIKLFCAVCVVRQINGFCVSVNFDEIARNSTIKRDLPVS